MKKINRALISVFNKEGIVEFAKSLVDLNVEIISTGGTAKLLEENSIQCKHVAEMTGAPEMLDGRVKTLHPKIHGAILAKRDNRQHIDQLKENNIEPIDMVVINLYPFAEVIGKAETDIDIALENIDIGGPTMIRAAAKNFPDVAVVTSPDQYEGIVQELNDNDASLSHNTRKNLAVEAFRKTHQYDGIITGYLGGYQKDQIFPNDFLISLKKIQDLRYGENPHQLAAFYKESNRNQGITNLEQLHGKELSYNNLMDLDAVVKMVNTFDEPCSVIVKHSNPCGVGVSDKISGAFEKAFATDSVSAFGGIYGFNRNLDLKTAEALRKIFIEVIIAPDYDSDAFQLLSKKKNLRLLKLNIDSKVDSDLTYRKVAGGLLVQQEDAIDLNESELKVVSKREPSGDEMKSLRFAWKVIKWVKSNAVIFCAKDRTIGIGAGQMSRVDSSQLAMDKAKKSGLSLRGTVVASDAFFPFRDGVDVVAKAGATAIIQPGGSVRDEEVIQAADEHDLAMVFTGVRHFRH